MRAALYCRVSTAQQTEKFSLDAQRSILADYCKRDGHSAEFFVDAGISGETIAARPEFQRLLREVETGKFDVVLAVDADRYSRASDLTDWQTIKRTFREAGIRWGTPSQWLHDNEFITDINAAVSAEEKRKILVRRAANSKPPGGASTSTPSRPSATRKTEPWRSARKRQKSSVASSGGLSPEDRSTASSSPYATPEFRHHR